jgi:O-acetyl-ADP-ribose deacetylase (regulator of RNase III)
MPFQIIRNDITRVKADVIVNTANPHPVIGDGTDSAIYQAAGEKELLAARKKIGDIEPGQAAETPAFGLDAKYIIHTVGPIWVDGKHGERETLHSCYEKSLSLAAKLGAKSMAFPLIATGVYGFPKDEALDIALSEIGKFLLTHDMLVTLVVFDKKSFELSEKLVSQIDEFIDEYGVGLARKAEYGDADYENIGRRLQEEIRRLQDPDDEPAVHREESDHPSASDDLFAALDGKTLEEIIEDKGDTFQQRLFKLIDERGLKDPEVYNKAWVDRKVFSTIRNNIDYKPSKRTAVNLAIALELDLPAMQDLLARGGIAFSRSNLSDLIIAYFVKNGKYDLYEIDKALFKYDQPTLTSIA